MRFPRASMMILCALMIVPAYAFAGSHPQSRNGFFIGFGLGGGNAGIKNGDNRKTGGAGIFRIGYAVKEDLVFGLESSGWTKSETDMGVDLTLTFSVATFGVTYYPGNQGLYIKGGIGFASSSWEAAMGNAKATYSDHGFGLLGGAGYEFRLTDKFALGPEVDFAYLNVGGVVESANFVSGHLMLNWYW